MADVTARADRGENVIRKAAAFKVFASEMCGRVVDRVVQIYGGAGYLAEYDAERFFRDARIYRIYEGTAPPGPSTLPPGTVSDRLRVVGWRARVARSKPLADAKGATNKETNV